VGNLNAPVVTFSDVEFMKTLWKSLQRYYTLSMNTYDGHTHPHTDARARAISPVCLPLECTVKERIGLIMKNVPLCILQHCLCAYSQSNINLMCPSKLTVSKAFEGHLLCRIHGGMCCDVLSKDKAAQNMTVYLICLVTCLLFLNIVWRLIYLQLTC
jgi:hypothetical protein